MKTIPYTPLAGSHISNSISEAIVLAVRENANVQFDFNGITLIAGPSSSRPELEACYDFECECRRKEYEESAEGIEAKKRRAREIVRKQKAVDALMSGLDSVVHDLDKLMPWLRELADVGDDIGVSFPKGEVSDKLEAAGYVSGYGVGEAPEWFGDRERLGRYIAGQSISCMRRGMSPHPMAMTFVDKYLTLPAL